MSPYFTLYTPTYNRCTLLPRVYGSLLAQDERDFEWIVVDDGSTDDTEARVRAWMTEAPFAVRYLKQANQGKHIATNRAVEMATGGMFVIVDSDDWLTQDSLAAVRAAWEAIPVDERSRFGSIGGLYLDPGGAPVTRLFPADVFDSNSVEIETRHGISGEIAMATRTAVRREFPFPENVGRYCMPSLVWNRMARRYQTRYLNTALQYKEYQQQGITLGGAHRKVSLSPEAFRLRSSELLDMFELYVPARTRARAMRMYVRASLHARYTLAQQFAQTRHRALWLAQALKGWRDYRRDLALLRT